MGFFFTFIYTVIAYLGPETIFGLELAQDHIQVVIVVIALIAALFSASGTRLLTSLQTWAILGLCVAVACSIIANGWLGGGLKVLVEFLPDVATFFLIAITCKKKWQIQVLVAALFFVAVFDVGMALYGLATGDALSKYVLMFHSEDTGGATIARIHGVTFLGDPNDFAQFLVSLIPCMFLFWAKDKGGRNIVMVYLPVAFLVYGMYLTHSRGGMLALMVTAIAAGRRKLKLVPAVLIGVALFAALSLAGFSGGRDVGSSEDRLEAWSTGLELVRAHPVFGVGYNLFSDHNEITAHNTFVVCVAETGGFGVFCWILMMLLAIRNVYVTSKDPAAAVEDKNLPKLPRMIAGQATAGGGGGPGVLARSAASLTPAPLIAGSSQSFAFAGGVPAAREDETALRYPADIRFGESETQDVSDEEIRRMCNLMVVMFAGFLTASWFLSRAFAIPLYVNAGLAVAIYGMARKRGLTPPEMPVRRALKMTMVVLIALLAIVYVTVRVNHMLPH